MPVSKPSVHPVTSASGMKHSSPLWLHFQKLPSLPSRYSPSTGLTLPLLTFSFTGKSELVKTDHVPSLLKAFHWLLLVVLMESVLTDYIRHNLVLWCFPESHPCSPLSTRLQSLWTSFSDLLKFTWTSAFPGPSIWNLLLPFYPWNFTLITVLREISPSPANGNLPSQDSFYITSFLHEALITTMLFLLFPFGSLPLEEKFQGGKDTVSIVRCPISGPRAVLGPQWMLERYLLSGCLRNKIYHFDLIMTAVRTAGWCWLEIVLFAWYACRGVQSCAVRIEARISNEWKEDIFILEE